MAWLLRSSFPFHNGVKIMDTCMRTNMSSRYVILAHLAEEEAIDLLLLYHLWKSHSVSQALSPCAAHEFPVSPIDMTADNNPPRPTGSSPSPQPP